MILVVGEIVERRGTGENMNESLLKNYYEKLRRSAFIKSLLWGLAFGFSAAFIAGFITWFSYEKGFFITIAVFAAVTVAATLACYYAFFRPTAKDAARKVDSLGLEERMITMLELEGCEDYIAVRQREDAKAALEEFGEKKLGLGVSLALIIALSISAALGIAGTAVTGLSDLGVIRSGAEIVEEAQGKDPRNYVTIKYEATSGGNIAGNAEQTIRKNGSTETVVAVATEGFRFFCWTDGYAYPARSDERLTESETFTALFVQIGADGAEEKPAGDESDDQPPEDGNDAEEEENPPSGSTHANYDYVVDWTIHYRDILGDYYDLAMKELSGGGEISEELRKFIENYFNSLK